MHPSNRAAVQRSIQVRQQHHQIVQQNMRRQMMNRQLLLRQVVQEAVETRPSHEDVQQLAAIVEEAEKIGVEPEQLEANIRESTPFGWLLALLPQDRGERIAYLAIFVEVLLFLVGRVLPPEPRPEPTDIHDT